MITEVFIHSQISLSSIILLSFPIELLVIEFIYLFYAKRQRNFFLRVFIVVLIAILYCAFVPQLVQNQYIALIYFTVLFFISILAMKFCFKASLNELLFCCCAGFCTQNIAVNASSLLVMICGLEFPQIQILSLCIRLAIFILVYSIAYIVCVRRFSGSMQIGLSNGQAAIFACMTIFVSNFMNVFSLVGVYDLLSSVVIKTAIVLCDFFVIFVQFGLLTQDSLKNELENIKGLLKKDEKLYEQSKNNINILNMRLHDLKYVLDVSNTNAGASLQKELLHVIKEYDAIVHTGNDVLDVVLSEKNIYAQNKGIVFTLIVDGSGLAFMDCAELYSLFGNLLDNAIEGVERVREEGKKTISLTVMQAEGSVSITEENFFEGKMVFEDGLPVTSKKDGGLHGYGLKSIGYITRKYGGELSIKIDGNIFSLTIVFPLRQKTSGQIQNNSGQSD